MTTTGVIKLSNLETYKNKISSQISELEKDLEFGQNSNILGMFGIKNFTNKGITKSGNVQIDENGIASNFINKTDYVITNLNILDLQLPYEFQIKFKVSDKSAFNELHLISNKTYAYPYYELAIAKDKIILESFITQSYNANVLFYDSFNFVENKWYIINMKHKQEGIYECSVYDEHYTELYNKTQKSNYEINYHSDTIILGNDVDYVTGSATLQIDLSETWFKRNDTIISEWNK